jgi:hypothetical protein
MKLPNEQSHGAGADERTAHPNETSEPLFGDDLWIEERLRVLLMHSGQDRPGGTD